MPHDTPLTKKQQFWLEEMGTLPFSGHQAIDEHVDAVLVRILFEPLEIDNAISVGEENILAAIAALGDVVGNRSGPAYTNMSKPATNNPTPIASPL